MRGPASDKGVSDYLKLIPLKIDGEGGGVRTPHPLDPRMTYSMKSEIDNFNA